VDEDRQDYPRSVAPRLPYSALHPFRNCDTYEVTLARGGRIIEIVTVQAPTEDAANEHAQRYLFANIYPLRTEKIDRAGS
jgi:hypothetical protein